MMNVQRMGMGGGVNVINSLVCTVWVGINSGPKDQGPGTRGPAGMEIYTLYNLY